MHEQQDPPPITILAWCRKTISYLYYKHGLFCSSHPYATILLVIAIFSYVCYPLTRLPLPGNPPLEFATKRSEYNYLLEDNTAEAAHPRWFQGQPVGFIQRVLMRTVVSPWNESLIAPDAFRVPLSKVFGVLDHLNSFRVVINGSERTLGDYCFHVSEVLASKGLRGVMPEYKCLVVSHAGFWGNDFSKFQADPDIVKTMYSYKEKNSVGPPTIKDIASGVAGKDMGVKKFFMRSRQRVITFAITIVLKEYNQKFIDALTAKLLAAYPLSSMNGTEDPTFVHLYYKKHPGIIEYVNLLITYVILLLYIYFSVKKIEMVKSKWGLAVSAVCTVIASLLMSLSVCVYFGLTPTVNKGEIFPYLVVILGLENILVLTKSVVSTPVDLDVKLRIAQGLSREGWSITKNLLTELLILFIGFFTFVPAIQEFCLFAVIGLISDFFLQLFFFTTVLSIDIRRIEVSEMERQRLLQARDATMVDMPFPVTNSSRCPVMDCFESPARLSRPKSSAASLSSRNTSVSSSPRTPTPSDAECGFEIPLIFEKLPKRLKFLYFWARTRMMQRVMMVCTVIWIGLILHRTGVIVHLVYVALKCSQKTLRSYVPESTYNQLIQPAIENMSSNTGGVWGIFNGLETDVSSIPSDVTAASVHYENTELWRSLSFNHFPTLFGYYNISLNSHFITILPSIPLSMLIPSEEATGMRHPKEREVWIQRINEFAQIGNQTVLTPESMELAIAVVLALPSFIFFVYCTVMCYKCMCSRNYAKWRSSWPRKGRRRSFPYHIQLLECIPIKLLGHTHEVDHLTTGGTVIASVCLAGQICVWDAHTGDPITFINRDLHLPKDTDIPSERAPCDGQNINDEESNDNNHALHKNSLPAPQNNNPSLQYVLPLDQMAGYIKTNFSGLPIAARDGACFSVENTNLISQVSNAGGNVQLSEKPTSPAKVTSSPGGSSRQHRRTASDGHALLLHRSNIGATLLYSAETVPLPIPLPVASNDMQKISTISHGRRSVGSDCDDTRFHQLPSHGRNQASPVWSLCCHRNLIAVGCANGNIEFWDCLTGMLRCHYKSRHQCGVTHICMVDWKVIVAQANGFIDFLELETFGNCLASSVNSTIVRARGTRFAITGTSSSHTADLPSWDGMLRCTLIHSTLAHQKLITVLQTEAGRLISGSDDSTLKIFRLEDSLCLYTLHGHKAGITTLCVDNVAPLAAISGSKDGCICIWDLLTGACVHQLQRHSGGVTALASSTQHIVSIGLDDRMHIWERISGTLLHKITLESGFCSSIQMLSNRLLVIASRGSLVLWDIFEAKMVRIIRLGTSDSAVFVRHIHILSSNVIACDYGSQLRIVRFPSLREKGE